MKTDWENLAAVPKPLLALIFSSALGTGLLIVRVVITHRMQHVYLFGNLILAWIPLLASMLLEQWEGNAAIPQWKRSAAVGVVLFLSERAVHSD